MEIKLSYQNVKQLLPFSKTYFNTCITSNVWQVMMMIYLIVSLLFHSYVRSIIGNPTFIFIDLCIIILFTMKYMFAFVMYKKFNQSVLKIDFNKGYVTLSKKGAFPINRQKSTVINQSDVLLIINLYSSFKFAIPITFDSCDEVSIRKLIDYIS